MKRAISSDSFIGGNGLIPISPGEEENLFVEEADGEQEGWSGGPVAEKKRRLSVEQVRALEKNFEVENKLDPERKARLAGDLGLQPRQVAVWFQNRRARWKTKQLERDYSALRASYDALSVDCDSLRREKDGLLAEIAELREKLSVEEESYRTIKEETLVSESKNKTSDEQPAAIYKDGSSDSDSSAVLNEENIPACEMAAASAFQFENSDWRSQRSFFWQHQLMKAEDQQDFSEFFPEELQWNLMEG